MVSFVPIFNFFCTATSSIHSGGALGRTAGLINMVFFLVGFCFPMVYTGETGGYGGGGSGCTNTHHQCIKYIVSYLI